METVSVSPKFQVFIPRRIREALGIRPGQKMQALQYGDCVELIPVLPLTPARGFLTGLETDVDREGDRT
jgi:AbrB family looped-hinge helix DNA binding protein